MAARPDQPLDTTDVLSRADGVLEAPLGDEVALMRVDTGFYFSLNRVGSVIWRLLEKPKSLNQVLAALESRYDVAASGAATWRDEVLDFVAQARADGIIVVVARPPSPIPHPPSPVP